MSLNPQRLASIGLVAAALGGLAWSEFSGRPVGPAAATAAPVAEGQSPAAASPSGADSSAARDDFRILLAGTIRSYADANELSVDGIQDPFTEPASWSAPAVIEVTDSAEPVQIVAQPQASELILTAVLDAPTGPVARVNGVLLVVGRPTEIPGVGTVELVEVGADGRSAVIKTPSGSVRVELHKVIG